MLDAVVHNAATFDYAQKVQTASLDGVEAVWATNHLGAVLLTDRLLPALEKSEQGRVVFISSKGLAVSPGLRIDVDDVEFKRRTWTVTKAHYQSKLAQVIFAQWLSKSLRARGGAITVNTIRVGNVKIDLRRYPNISTAARWAYSLKSRFSMTPAEMAKTYTWLVTSAAASQTGGYFDAVDVPVKANRSAYDDAHCEAVLRVTKEYLEGQLQYLGL